MTRKLLISACLLAILRSSVIACASGCSVFAVGSRWSMPTSSGLSTYLQYDFMDQSTNRGAWRRADSATNPDREIRAHFYTIGAEYMVDRERGVGVEIPVWDRFCSMMDGGNLAAVNHTSVGDIRLLGTFTGLSEDMSTGIQFDLKLPSGSFTQSLLDRDTQIGTGTTDGLVGFYHVGQEDGWGWFGRALWQHALVGVTMGYAF